MKLRYVLGGIAVALILVACSKPKQEPAPEADKATTEQVAKEAEAAAQTQPAGDTAPKADESKSDEPAKTDKPKADQTADTQTDGELKAEDRVSEDQKY